MTTPYLVESLLSARLFLNPQLCGDELFFISDLSGRLSLYKMRVGGSVPEPLIPPHIALPNPHHFEGNLAFQVLPKLGKILLMLDHEGDENYQPMFVPIDGGIPEPAFGERFAGQMVLLAQCNPDKLTALFNVDARKQPIYESFVVDLQEKTLTSIGQSDRDNYPMAINPSGDHVLLADGYTSGDVVLFLWVEGEGARRPFFGKAMAERGEGELVTLSGFASGQFTEKGVLLVTALFDDTFSLGYMLLDAPQQIQPVTVTGIRHRGVGEMERIEHLTGTRYALRYNIDGCSWLYEGSFNDATRHLHLTRVFCGEGELSNGVLESYHFDEPSGRVALSFSSATSPAQLYVIDGESIQRQTNERVLGIAPRMLSPGEDASFTSFDGLRISARLYLPAAELGYRGKRPVIFYIHGGPQSQERPDFTWFSMALIQFFTLNGFAVFVPNVRGSSGYGLSYLKWVDRDWGGKDRLDHVHAFEQLRNDPRLDLDRAGVMGRSYGGFMTLTQVGRHPELWKAACDMFGPYSLFTFLERIPETWKSYFHLSLGHPERDREFLIERSPSTYIHNLACPMLVIQGANDPRVIERESRDVVEQLQAQGKEVEYIVYHDEGHDVIKYVNKVDCYSRIVSFFAARLKP